jgi:biopolymer transport protein ExbD
MAGGINQRPAGEDPAEVHEINVVPFIDVMLVLLVIFMVAAPLATVDVPVDLPAATAEPQPRPEAPVYVTLRDDLTLALGAEAVVRTELASALDAATGGDREARVFLRADRTVAYGDLMALMNDLRARATSGSRSSGWRPGRATWRRPLPRRSRSPGRFAASDGGRTPARVPARRCALDGRHRLRARAPCRRRLVGAAPARRPAAPVTAARRDRLRARAASRGAGDARARRRSRRRRPRRAMTVRRRRWSPSLRSRTGSRCARPRPWSSRR